MRFHLLLLLLWGFVVVYIGVKYELMKYIYTSLSLSLSQFILLFLPLYNTHHSYIITYIELINYHSVHPHYELFFIINLSFLPFLSLSLVPHLFIFIDSFISLPPPPLLIYHHYTFILNYHHHHHHLISFVHWYHKIFTFFSFINFFLPLQLSLRM